jgi:hypothetical protein
LTEREACAGQRDPARRFFVRASNRRDPAARDGRRISPMAGVKNPLLPLARKLASLSYEDRRRVIAEAERIEHEHFARVRMLASEQSDAAVRNSARSTRERRAAAS